MSYTRPYRYPNGEPIPKDLPDAYQPADNPGVPQGQRCDNCAWYEDGKCVKFNNSPVRAYYWCKVWKSKGK